MNDYKEMVKKSRFADFKGCSQSERKDYRCSFLQGVYYLLCQQGNKFCLIPEEYDSVPSVLKLDGRAVKCSFTVAPSEFIDESPCHFEVDICYDGDETVYTIDESEFRVDQARDLFAFVFCAVQDSGYKDIDEFYEMELS